MVNSEDAEAFATVRHLADASVTDDDGRVDFLVGVTADNHIDTGHLAGDFEVVIRHRGVHTEMRETDDQVALLSLEFRHHVAGDLGRIEVGNLAGVLR